MRYGDAINYYFHDHSHVGELGVANNILTGKAGSSALGELVELQLNVENGVIKAAKFKAYGSVTTVAACSWLTQWLENKTVEQAKALTLETISAALELPDTKRHSALLVIDALSDALESE